MHDLARNFGLACAPLLLLVTASSSVQAQDDGPPNVLVVHREYLKPGKAGAIHDRSESAFVRAFANANFATHYAALSSLSGPSRSLYLIPYKSFADWEKDNAAVRANASLSAAVDRATFADGDLLSAYDDAALYLRPDLGLGHGQMGGTHFFEIGMYIVKPGHSQEFEELAKLYADAFHKLDPAAHWDVFQLMYGVPSPNLPAGDVFFIMTTMKSMAEVDTELQDFQKAGEAMGADGMKKANDLMASSVASFTTNLFQINPDQSYPSPDWVSKDPTFWKTTPPAGGKKAGKQPATP